MEKETSADFRVIWRRRDFKGPEGRDSGGRDKWGEIKGSITARSGNNILG